MLLSLLVVKLITEAGNESAKIFNSVASAAVYMINIIKKSLFSERDET
jgi:hypothetical protein